MARDDFHFKKEVVEDGPGSLDLKWAFKKAAKALASRKDQVSQQGYADDQGVK